jgi:hypothetical protein
MIVLDTNIVAALMANGADIDLACSRESLGLLRRSARCQRFPTKQAGPINSLSSVG